MANNDKNFKVKNGLDVKGGATIDNDLLVSGTLTAQVNTPTQDSDVVNKAYVDAIDTHDSAAVVGQINLEVDADFVEAIRPAETIFDLTGSGSGNYTFSGDGFPTTASDPVLHLTRGKTYKFANVSGSHPFEIRVSSGGSAYSDGVTNNGGSGTVLFTVPMNAPAELVYQCTIHSSMLGTIYIDDKVGVDSDQVSNIIIADVDQTFIDQFDTHDSAAVQGQIDATIALSDTHDSAAVVGQINLEVDQTFINQFDTHDSAAVLGQINATVNQSFIDAFDTHDSAAVQGQIDTTIAATDTHDSAAVLGQINATVNQSFIDALDTHDSAAVLGQINASIAATDTHDSAAVVNQIEREVDLAFINALDASATNLDSDLIPGLVLGTDVNGNYVADVTGTANQIEVTHTQGEGSTPVIGLPNNVTIDSDLTVNGVIKGPATMIIDPALHGDSSGTLVILGNLQVDGVSTVIQSSTVSITDKNIVLADSATNNTEANGAGITVNGANASITYVAAGDKWELNKAPYYLNDRLLTTADDTHDSAAVVGQINDVVNAAYVQGKIDQTFINTFDTHDSAAVVGQIGLEVDQTFIDQFDTHDSAAVLGQINATVNQTFIDALDTHDSAAVLGQINAVIAVTDTHDSAAVLGQINATVNQAYIDALDTHDSAAVLGQINAVIAVTDTHDSAAVLGQINAVVDALDTHDSAAVLGQINATVNQAYIDALDTHDSAAVVGQIGLEVTKTFVDALNVDADTLDGQDGTHYLDYNNFTNTPTLPAQVISYDSASELADSAVNARTDQDLFTTSDVEFNKVTSNLVGSVHFTAQNDEGTALAIGDVVYIKGISGNTPTVAKADADDAAKMPAFGIVSNGANDGANVTVTTFGEIANIDTSTLSLGDTLYVSSVAGAFTATKPTGQGSLLQNVGQVTRVHASTGSIKVLGAGRTAATPNLDQNNIFIGNASNQSITMSIDSAVSLVDTHDSAAVVGQIGLEVTKTFIDALNVDADTLDNQDGTHYLDYTNFTNTPTIPAFGTDYVDSAAARGLVSGNKGLSYNSTTGVFDIDSANIYGFTIDSARTIDLIDSAYIQPLARAAIVAGTNITYDSATGVIASTASGGAYDSAMTGAQIDSAALSYTLDFVTTKGNTTTNDITVGALIADSATFDTDTLVVDATNNRVGVGTTSPTAKLDVNGEVFVSTLTPSTDSALATKKYVDDNAGGGTSSSHTVAIGLLNAGLDVGDPIYYDSDATKWVGAVDSAAGVASHVVVDKGGSDFKIAQTGVFTLTPNQGLDINSYYYLGNTEGVYTTTQPTNGIYQSLFYAVDSSTVDVNIAEAQDISPSNPNETRITTINITSTPYTIPVNSTGKMFVLGSGAGTLNLNAANFFTGDVLTLYNNSASTRTLTFDTYSDAVRIPGSATNYSASSLTVEAYGMASVTAITDNGLIITGGVS